MNAEKKERVRKLHDYLDAHTFVHFASQYTEYRVCKCGKIDFKHIHRTEDQDWCTSQHEARSKMKKSEQDDSILYQKFLKLAKENGVEI